MKSLLATALVISALTAGLAAHEVSYKGTVVTATHESIKITVVDEKTKKPTVMSFDLDKETKIFRGEKAVTFDEAKILKDETVVVVIDHDLDETLAMSIRIQVKKR
jgi:hypothetical protein